MEQNALYNSEKGSEVGGPGSVGSLSNVGERERDPLPTSPVASFTTSSSWRTKSSHDRFRTGSPPTRDSSGPPSRQHDPRSSPFDTLDSHTMSDSASKFSEFSIDPDYNIPPKPKSAPPINPLTHYKDAFSVNMSSQAMANSLTPYSQQQNPSQAGHLDKLSMDVMYHTQQSSSLSGLSIVPRLLHGKDGKPYLGKIHLKELDGDEIDMEKQRIKLMFYEKQHAEKCLQEESNVAASSKQERENTPNFQLAYTHPQDTQALPNLKEEDPNIYSDDEELLPGTAELLRELKTLEHMASEQRRRWKELKVARERESLNLKQRELEFEEQQLHESSGALGLVQQERWQKEQKRKLRSLERFRTDQQEKIQKLETDEHHAKSKLKALDTNIRELQKQLEASSRPTSAAIINSHMQAYHLDLPSKLPPERPSSRRDNGASRTHMFTSEPHLPGNEGYGGIKSEAVMQPEREWPKEPNSKPNPARFISMESITTSSLPGNELPEFSREIVNTISESTNMTEPTQDDPIPVKWPNPGKVAPNMADDPYGSELQSKFSYSDDEFLIDKERMMRLREEFLQPVGHPQPFNAKNLASSPFQQQEHQPSRVVLNSSHYQQPVSVTKADHTSNDATESSRPQYRGQGGPPKQPAPHPPERPSSGRTNHHYSRSNRPRPHTRNHNHSSETSSAVSVATSSTSRANAHFTTVDTVKATDAPDVVPTFSASPPLISVQLTGSGSKQAMKRAPEQMSVFPSSTSRPYSPYRDHPPQYAVPSASGGVMYDIPKKATTKPPVVAPLLVYDQPRSTSSSLQHTSNHISPTSPHPQQPSCPPPPEMNRSSPFHNLHHERSNLHKQLPPPLPSLPQHYDMPKPIADSPIKPVERELRQAPPSSSSHPYQYHGLPTKPTAHSYSRGRQDGLVHADRGYRGHAATRPTQRIQRQQTEL